MLLLRNLISSVSRAPFVMASGTVTGERPAGPAPGAQISLQLGITAVLRKALSPGARCAGVSAGRKTRLRPGVGERGELGAEGSRCPPHPCTHAPLPPPQALPAVPRRAFAGPSEAAFTPRAPAAAPKDLPSQGRARQRPRLPATALGQAWVRGADAGDPAARASRAIRVRVPGPGRGLRWAAAAAGGKARADPEGKVSFLECHVIPIACGVKCQQQVHVAALVVRNFILRKIEMTNWVRHF